MRRTLFKSLLILMATIINAKATIYVGYSNPQNNEKALAVITSGPIDIENRIMSAQKNKGLIGWSGGGRVSSKADEVLFQMMAKNEKASSIEAKIESLYPTQYYRLLFITPAGELGSVLPKNGCPELECGKRVENDFIIIGGGLEAQVLDKTTDEFRQKSAETETPTACKMLAILNFIVKIGGEKKTFTSAQIAVDSPLNEKLLRSNSFISNRTKSEKAIIQNLNDDLKTKGINCSI